MLGRLRMSIEECWKEYLRLNDVIFVRPRYLHIYKYRASALEEAIKLVVRKYCQDSHEIGTPTCDGDCILRQADYAHVTEHDEELRSERLNVRCKVAVVSWRRGFKQHHGPSGADVVHIFRSFDHPRRSEARFQHQPNPGPASTTTRIWEAARATSAAPLHFSKIRIDGQKHMDGAVDYNNPTELAYNVARQMNPDDTIGVILSIGTGQKRPQSIFGNFADIPALLRYGRRSMTDPSAVHRSLLSFTENGTSPPYIRLDVDDGMGDIPLDEWKKKKVKKTCENTAERPDIFISSGVSRFERTTLRTIMDKTEGYLEQRNVRERIERCAQILVDHARERRRDERRWKSFVARSWPPAQPGEPEKAEGQSLQEYHTC